MIEIVTFSLRDGLDDVEEFLAADARVQAQFAYQQAGLVRRTTARSADGRWLVLTLWGSAADADRAAIAATSDSTVSTFESFIDPSSRRTERFEALD